VVEPHTDSYYAATLNEKTNYPRLTESVSCDVAVVGGGFSGVATSLSLAERGYDVVLLEQHKIGWGASGRNGGQLIQGISGSSRIRKQMGPEADDMLWELSWLGHRIIEERIEKFGIDCDFKRGYIEVAFKERQMRWLREDLDGLRERNSAEQARLVGREEIVQLLGTDAYLGGLINNLNGHLHPLNLCVGEARAASELGARIFEGTEVLGIEHGDKPRLRTPTGTVQANTVVLAGNAYQRLDTDRLSGLLFPAGSYIIATEPLIDEEVQSVNPLDLAVCDLNNVLDYYRLSADRRLLFGGRCNYSGRDPKSIRDSMLPRLLKIYPQLRGKRIDFEWGGNIGIVVNRVPLIRRLEKNVFSAMGYSGHGINVSHIAGAIMADAVAGTFEKLDVFDRITHQRIPFGRWFGNQIVALGMLYYRMRDLL
jgi:glycine/D-amino acid oxidase-like deaminating enzyme